MRVLLLEEDPSRLELLRFFMEGRFQLDVLPTGSLDEAKKALEAQSFSFSMVVCDFLKPSGRELMRFVFEASAPVYFVCSNDTAIDLSESKKLKDWVHFLDPGDFFNKLGRKVVSLDPSTEEDRRAKSLQFARVRYEFLLLFDETPVDLFLKKGESAFMKVLPAKTSFNEQHVALFRDKHQAKHLFVRAQDVLTLTLKLQDRFYPGQKAIVEDFGSDGEEDLLGRESSAEGALSPIQVADQLSHNLEHFQSMSARLGFTEEVQNFAKNNVNKTIEEVKKSPRLSMILSQLNQDKEKYISSHSLLLSYVSCALATQVQWKSDTTYQKLSLAAFLHDITLSNQELAHYDALRKLVEDRDKFTEVEFKQFRTHPLDAAEIARQFNEVPPDVDQIVAQHHEKPDGSGFPRGLTHTRINPLSVVFIVSHDIVRYLIENNLDAGMSEDHWKEFLTQHEATYKYSQFKKLLGIFKEIKL